MWEHKSVIQKVFPKALLFLRWNWLNSYELNQRFRQHTCSHRERHIHTLGCTNLIRELEERLTLKLWTFSYLGAKSLSLRVARRTSEVSCERAKDLIGCQKVEAGEVGLEGAGWWPRYIPDPVPGSEALPDTGREGIEPALTFKPRAAVNKEPFWLVSFPPRLRCCFLPLLTTYDSRLGIAGPVDAASYALRLDTYYTETKIWNSSTPLLDS